MCRIDTYYFIVHLEYVHAKCGCCCTDIAQLENSLHKHLCCTCTVCHSCAFECWLRVQMLIACMHCNKLALKGQTQVEVQYR